MRAIPAICMTVVLTILLVAAYAVSPSLLEGSGYSKSQDDRSKIDSSLANRLRMGETSVPVIVIFKEGQSVEDQRLNDLGLKVRYYYHLINGLAASGSSASVKNLAHESSVDKIYLDGGVRTARPPTLESDTENPVYPSQVVNADMLWNEGIDGTGVLVAVIDSGIDKNHPDLVGKVVGERNFVDEEDTTDDLLGHGTLCAGIIAGSGAASGGKYRGIAPGASLLNVRVIASDGNGQVSDIIAGIEWALDSGADVLSLSLAGYNLGETNPPVTMAADNAMDAGAVVCVAAGNNG